MSLFVGTNIFALHRCMDGLITVQQKLRHTNVVEKELQCTNQLTLVYAKGTSDSVRN